jgi:4-hydroxy-tetrahydrodipicolinate reductase
MKIGLIGYGKMGKAIEKIALENNHTITAIVKNNTDWNLLSSQISVCDVLIEFSIPEAAFDNINKGLDFNKPIICGTTGWLHLFDKIESRVKEINGAFLYASNFSLGVNQFFQLTQLASSIFAQQINPFQPDITEIHHIHKKDAPSGTAITIQNMMSPFFKELPPIVSIREDEVPGTHIIQFKNEIESIEIKHTAFSRDGFAKGAVKAAEWIKDKKGIFSMDDVLKA